MRKRILFALLAAAWLIAAWNLASWAQAIDTTPCQKSCYDQKTMCVTACGTHNNPIECEEQCHEQLTDCLRECR